ncbi:hypothetical protein AC1031_019491 [Aphanomyces cochlioides]|nr:hypothetical protein AC1031_019491 [Aphanomyces cochlioides]
MWSLDETALDLVHRTWLDRPFKSGIDVLDDVFPDGIKARSVLEVYGDAESPKSLLLQHVAIAYLLHDERAQVHYFDHECMFSMELIKQMLIARNPEETGERLEKILERWTVYHCESSDDWTAQIESLNAKLLRQRDILPLIAIDCIGSFHLIDKVLQSLELLSQPYRHVVGALSPSRHFVQKKSYSLQSIERLGPSAFRNSHCSKEQ